MKEKRKKIIIFFILIIILLLIIGVFFIINKNRDIPLIEYIPEEEISDEQLRQTKISLYFKNENNLVPEIRKLDAKKLLINPYEEILNLLIEGPKNENFQRLIPNGTKINKIEKKGDILIIDFSEEFLNNENKELTINSLVNSLTEFTEINKIKILINGNESIFNEIYERKK